MDSIHILFFFKDQVRKLLLTMHKDQPIVKKCRAVVRLHNTDARKPAIDEFIGDAVFSAEVFVIQTELAKSDTTDRFSGVIVVDVRLIVNDFFVNVFESQLSEPEHASTFSFLRKSQRYHFFGRLMAISVPNIPAIVPVINPAITSVG